MAAKSYDAGVRKYYGDRLTNISDDTTSEGIRHVYDDWVSEYDKVTTTPSDYDLISYPDLTLFYTGRGRSGYEINYDLDSVYTGVDKFLHRHELARIRLSLTRDLRNRARF